MTDLSDTTTYPAGPPLDEPTDETGRTAAETAETVEQRIPRRTRVLVVGAGFSGLAAVIGLTEAGMRDVVVIDRGHDVGGTWRDNTYPGAACDVPSQLYSFSFALNPDWSSSYSPQPEIERYLQGVTDRFGVRDHIYQDVDLTGARWIDEDAEWEVTTSGGMIRAQVVALGVGALCEPRLPDIPGIDSFEGDLFHTARWDHDVDLTGKRVGVIGTGASAIQIVPQLAKITSHLDVYQRTAPWIVPRNDHAYGRIARLLMHRVPGWQRLMRTGVYWWLESRVFGFVKKPDLLKKGQALALAHMHHAVKDETKRAALTPDYTMGCKRILISNEYFPAVAQDTTDLVTDPIAEIRPHSIVTRDGTERPIDALVVATGFFVTDNPTMRLVVGRTGKSLTQFWDEGGMAAYKGTTVPEFPNLFQLLGPNTGLGHSSMVQMAEAHAGYFVDAVRQMDEFGLATVEVRPDVYRTYTEKIQKDMRGTVWSTGNCASWYKDKHGNNTTLWPSWTFTFRRMLQRFDLADYRSVAAGDRAADNTEEVAA